MKMIRTIYRIDDKDFEEFNRVSFNFILPKNSVQTFLNLCDEHSIRIKSISGEQNKTVKTESYPNNLCNLAKSLGVKDWNELQNNWYLTHSKLRFERFKHKTLDYMCYNPQTKTTELKSNSPFVIKGNQSVYHGKLWRRIIKL